MKPGIIRHKGKGAQQLPNRAALNSLASGRKPITSYAKATPSIVQSGPSVVEQEQDGRRK